nr:copper-binding protein [Rhodoferax sp.]
MKITKFTSIALVTATLTATVLSGAAYADGKGQDHAKADPMKGMAMADADMTNAEVRKIDKDAKKITLKHEAIKNLDMPGMTMVFQVKDASMLDKVQAGDKIKFKVSSEGGAYVVTAIEPTK